MPSNTNLSERPSDGRNEPIEETEEQAADDQPAEESEEKPADEKATEESESKTSDEQAPRQTAGEGAGAQPAKPSDGAGGKSDKGGAKGELSAGRKEMLKLIETWMPTSLNNPNKPPKETQDLMGKAGWNKRPEQQARRSRMRAGTR